MTTHRQLTFGVASEPWELEQVHQLNYRTFVEEIPQHDANARRRLVDPLLRQSTCFVCHQGERLIGMVAVNGTRPFSLDRKLDDLDTHLPPGSRACEVRLLAVEPDTRVGRVFMGLMRCVLDYCDEHGFDMAVFSGAKSQERMYRRAGCVAFGPTLGTPEAPFRAMYISKTQFSRPVRRLFGMEPDGEDG